MVRLSGVQEQIYCEVQARQEVCSLLSLTSSMGIDYPYAWWCVVMLAQMGLVVVTRKPGKPLVIRLAAGGSIPVSLNLGNREVGNV